VENKQVGSEARPDPEAQAGRALRRLRLAQGWSQEEAAKRMQAYGYDFHQTTIAKIEAAQRPLRVRELAHFADLYQVGAHELIYPLKGSPDEIDREITALAARRNSITVNLHVADMERAQARQMLDDANKDYADCARELALLEQQIEYLQAEKKKFAPWENDEEPDPDRT
jgi:transcriptional regulator with XRE-family HTH domain